MDISTNHLFLFGCVVSFDRSRCLVCVHEDRIIHMMCHVASFYSVVLNTYSTILTINCHSILSSTIVDEDASCLYCIYCSTHDYSTWRYLHKLYTHSNNWICFIFCLFSLLTPFYYSQFILFFRILFCWFSIVFCVSNVLSSGLIQCNTVHVSIVSHYCHVCVCTQTHTHRCYALGTTIPYDVETVQCFGVCCFRGCNVFVE